MGNRSYLGEKAGGHSVTLQQEGLILMYGNFWSLIRHSFIINRQINRELSKDIKIDNNGKGGLTIF